MISSRSSSLNENVDVKPRRYGKGSRECAWGSWKEWSTCSNGYQTRKKLKIDRISRGRPESCTGSGVERVRCGPPGKWTEWSRWTKCSRRCTSDQRSQIRRRECLGPWCCGENLERQNCPGNPTIGNIFIKTSPFKHLKKK